MLKSFSSVYKFIFYRYTILPSARKSMLCFLKVNRLLILEQFELEIPSPQWHVGNLSTSVISDPTRTSCRSNINDIGHKLRMRKTNKKHFPLISSYRCEGSKSKSLEAVSELLPSVPTRALHKNRGPDPLSTSVKDHSPSL